MNNEILPNVIVSGIHFALTPSLKTFVQQKAGRLLRHEERIIRLRVELDYEQKRPGHGWFIAKGHITSYGSEMSARVVTNECHQAISLLIDKLDRMLQRRATLEKARRHGGSATLLAAGLPQLG